MGVGMAILMETKVMVSHHPHLASEYKIITSKAASHNQGGLPCCGQRLFGDYEVELACITMPNPLTFQLITNNEQFYCMGAYIPPTDTMGVEDLQAASEVCSAGCTPFVPGDLNINFSDARNVREELIINLLNNINVVDVSRRFVPQQPRKQSTRARWT
jgi:hypothetical protein